MVLKDPVDEDKPFDDRRPWSWKKVMEQLDRVRQNPTLEFVHSLNASAAGVSAPGSNQRLIIELDMPGAPGMVAGPPPAGKLVDIAPISSLRHDRRWRREVKGRGFHQGVFDDLDRFYK
jgi:hypothetical protein